VLHHSAAALAEALGCCDAKEKASLGLPNAGISPQAREGLQNDEQDGLPCNSCPDSAIFPFVNGLERTGCKRRVKEVGG
jgi:hypothetical protein